MSTAFATPTRTRDSASVKNRPSETRRRSFTEQRRAARRAAADRSLRAQLVKSRSLIRLAVRQQESQWPFVIVFALIVGIAVVTMLMVNTATAQTSFTEQKLNDELYSLTLTEQQLQQQVAGKQAPEELAKRATELGMEPGANPGNLVVGADGSATWIEPTEPEQDEAPPPHPEHPPTMPTDQSATAGD
ncbi:hypothetical protein [Cumulibacter soli]|uniref:hypothetical protein n=1 Tax=Cumulibacter soli TaxID=2546344 RepID=UPI001067B2F4|nr:hypothetical protein [Cumulibacter soli]